MSSPAKSYRIYRLDGVLHIVTVDELQAACDAEAVSAVRESDFGLMCEIWEGDRMIARLDRDRPPVLAIA